MMNWEQLLQETRLCQETPYLPTPHRPPAQFDFDRITFSSAFRRLQDKTQVFPLSSSDYVRTRLTHSMEVATVGRSLGNMIGFELSSRGLLGGRNPLEVGMTVSAAALAHDIGNPPFGHSGEDSIRAWFRNSQIVKRAHESGELTDHQLSDFLEYEGNAQGFRIVSRLQMYKDRGGMRLTMPTLGAFTKYPVQSPSLDGGAKRTYSGKSTDKFGFFQAEAELFREVASATGLVARPGVENCWCRHPLAFLVEAADDICYRIVDLEDAFRQKLVGYSEIEEVLADLLGSSNMDRVRKEPDFDARVDVLRSLVIKTAVDAVFAAFQENHDAILRGQFDREIIGATSVEKTFAAIKEIQKLRVYKNNRVLLVEASGFRVIAGLLESFVTAVEDVHSQQELVQKTVPRLSQKLFDLIPDQFIGESRKTSPHIYHRMLRVIDYVCGMTDTYALELYRNISGISLP